MDDFKKSNNVIYINPHFRQTVNKECKSQLAAHINPLFLECHQKLQKTNALPKIYMNPMFLTKQLLQQKQTVQKLNNLTTTAFTSSVNHLKCDNSSDISKVGKIICKTRTRIIRETQIENSGFGQKVDQHNSTKPVITSNKQVTPTQNTVATNGNTELYSSKSKYKLVKSTSNIPSICLKVKNKSSFVKRYALRRAISNQLKCDHNDIKNVHLVNINGMLYNSTKNSLKRNEQPDNSLKTLNNKRICVNSQKSITRGLTIHIKGTKYVMDPQKYKLTRISNINSSPKVNRKTTTKIAGTIPRTIATTEPLTCRIPRRIDIGGITYKSNVSSKNDIFERTTNHLTRAYINNARQKSLQTLSKRLVKCNVPCPIYQFVGKCAAYERGKCSKLHDKLQVKLCSRFLRGECLNTKCLLSHNVCLAKMPACKFFLEGLCNREDCPYLHKKLSNDVDICVDFLRGFCQMADKCNKRHEFVCHEYERNGKCCANITCIYCKRNRTRLFSEFDKLNEQIENIIQLKINLECDKMQSKEDEEKQKLTDVLKQQTRYFNECNLSNDETAASSMITETSAANTSISDDDSVELEVEPNGRIVRKKLGPLPSYIPLK